MLPLPSPELHEGKSTSQNTHKGHFGTAGLVKCARATTGGKDRSLSEEPERTQHWGCNPAKVLTRLALQAAVIPCFVTAAHSVKRLQGLNPEEN